MFFSCFVADFVYKVIQLKIISVVQHISVTTYSGYNVLRLQSISVTKYIGYKVFRLQSISVTKYFSYEVVRLQNILAKK